MQVYQATDVGRLRPTNEDALAVLGENTYLVADGMGGHAAGEIASHALVGALKRALRDEPFPWNEKALSEAIRMANECILDLAQEQPEYRGMGTTATVLHIHDGRAYWSHVGDSRLYLLRDGILQQLTRDHTYVEGLVEQGMITREEARAHPKRNLLTRAVGVSQKIEVDAGRLFPRPGDRFLLCTDGLTNMVEEERIPGLLQDAANPAETLVRAALEAGGRDNITAIVLVYDDAQR